MAHNGIKVAAITKTTLPARTERAENIYLTRRRLGRTAFGDRKKSVLTPQSAAASSAGMDRSSRISMPVFTLFSTT